LELGRRFETEGDAGGLLRVGWWRYAAPQGILVQPDLIQHSRYTSLMGGCRVVRGTGQCQILGPEAKGVGGTAFDERDGLKRFRRGPEVGNMLGITMASEQSSAVVGNHNDARVDALDELSSSDFCQGG
jgi:hypothetical protein